jgi:hypothetical protein
MRRLYVRIAAGVVFAIVVGWAAAALSLAQLRGQIAIEPTDHLAGDGLLWIAAQLDDLPESLWDDRLADVRRYVRLSRLSLPQMYRRVRQSAAPQGSRCSSRPGPARHRSTFRCAGVHIFWWRVHHHRPRRRRSGRSSPEP